MLVFCPGLQALSVSAATPGSTWPPRNSSDAPPPVEMCVILSATPALLIAAIESPPPTIVVPFTEATAWRDGLGALGELGDLEHAHRAVPDHGLRTGDHRLRRSPPSSGRYRAPCDRRSPGR